MLRSSLLVLAVLLAAGAELPAQQIPPLEAGQRVRLRTATGEEEGYVEQLTRDTLVIERAHGYGELRVPLAALERLEVSRGYTSPGPIRGRGVLFGAAIGGGIGAFRGHTSGDDPPCAPGAWL